MLKLISTMTRMTAVVGAPGGFAEHCRHAAKGHGACRRSRGTRRRRQSLARQERRGWPHQRPSTRLARTELDDVHFRAVGPPGRRICRSIPAQANAPAAHHGHLSHRPRRESRQGGHGGDAIAARRERHVCRRPIAGLLPLRQAADSSVTGFQSAITQRSWAQARRRSTCSRMTTESGRVVRTAARMCSVVHSTFSANAP